MVLFWFLLALVLLVVAVVLLRLDAVQRRKVLRRRDETTTVVGPVDAAPVEDGAVGQAAPVSDGTVEEVSSGPVSAGAPEPRPAPFQAAHVPEPATVEPDPEPELEGDRAAQAAPADRRPEESEAASGPRGGLLSKVKGLLPAAVAGGAAASGGAATRRRGADDHAPTLEGSRAVEWLETREFAPTAEPAPELVSGEFAVGLPSLGTVSNGVFRGHAVVMGVSGDAAVFALRRIAASDVVVDLRRGDVDRVPGLEDDGHLAGRMVSCDTEGMVGLLRGGRAERAADSAPAPVRRLWLEGEWAVAVVDGTDDVGGWDDAVVALHDFAAAGVALPPPGGVADPIPSVADPGSPGAASGPTVVPTGTRPARPAPGVPDDDTPASARTTRIPAVPAQGPAPGAEADQGAVPDQRTVPDQEQEEDGGPRGARAGLVAGGTAAGVADLRSRRGGHLRAVPDRVEGVRDLGDEPIRPDRGDHEDAAPPTADEPTGAPDPAPADEPTGAPDPAPADAAQPEPSPFDSVMTPVMSPPSRGDVASDFLEPRPPLPRPTRSDPAAYGPADAGEDHRIEVLGEPIGERPAAAGRHGRADDDEATTQVRTGERPAWMRETSTAPRPGGGRHRRPDPDSADDGSATPTGSPRTETPGLGPDFEETARFPALGDPARGVRRTEEGDESGG